MKWCVVFLESWAYKTFWLPVGVAWAVIGTAFGVLRLGLNLPVSATLGAAIAMAWFFIAIAINVSAASYYARLRNRLTPP